MGKHVRVRDRRRRQGVGLGAVTAVVVAGMVVVGPAQAEPTSVNPFDLSRGFTVVARGDVTLSNSELEGSVAALGTISSGNQNGYPVVHQAAGTPDYTVPTVDGVPVRVLAERFVGTGALDVSNRDDSRTIAAGSPEATAVVKLVDVSNLRASRRGGGAGPAAGTDFLRVLNDSGPNDDQTGKIDLKTVPFAGASVADLATERSSVAAYFPEMEAQVARGNQCLAALPEAGGDLVRLATVEQRDGLAYLTGLATDRPNVVRYEELVGRTIKLEGADAQYAPIAEAPLILVVPAGTERLDPVRVERWSAHSSAQQSYARYIAYDLSRLTGTVTVDGLEMGAIWAPEVDLVFSSGVTTNGQWVARSVTTSGGGEIHHHDFLGQLPCLEHADPDPTDPTDPGQTEEPTDPTGPGETEEPTDPGETEEPTDPGQTEDPTDPADPGAPADPEEPSAPVVAVDSGEATSITTSTTGTGVVTGPGSGLARTGVGPGSAAAAAGLLLAAGAVVLAARRRALR
ncbi:MAG TPA: collagen-binding domain-containing protein [Phototrophicaceae bacterium]|nr:collagen-binding domain-containing protein [Phototrophicaceae bacterium]